VIAVAAAIFVDHSANRSSGNGEPQPKNSFMGRKTTNGINDTRKMALHHHHIGVTADGKHLALLDAMVRLRFENVLMPKKPLL